MAGKKRAEVTERNITGVKYFDKLVPLLERSTTSVASGIRQATANSTTTSIAS